MSIKIESTVENVSEELAKTGASGNQRVFVTVLDEEEDAKLVELRRLIDEGLASGDPIDGEEAFEQLRRNLIEKYPELADAPTGV